MSAVLALFPLLAPLVLFVAAAAGLREQSLRPRPFLQQTQTAIGLVLTVALIVACSIVIWGPVTSTLIGVFGFGLSVRLDALSATLFLLVSFVGFLVVRYSRKYLDGEPGQGPFTGWLMATLASVMLLVLAGNLVQFFVAWVATSFTLHKLLLFYPDRPKARLAARKKFITARIGDVSLGLAFLLLGVTFGTGDIVSILTQAEAIPVADAPASAVVAAALIALTAILKSAQFPTQGWLTEVMETPTPVSALLHAGVINAGGVLLIRFADVMLLSPSALAFLVIVGGFTALLGGLVMLTQSAVKASLAWSTVAQMGFMIMQCGLALFPLALLHIVAHSLYKAHAFLASGTAVDVVAAIRRPGPIAIPNAQAVQRAFVLALALYTAIGFAFGFESKSPQAVALGAILVFGVAYLFAQGLADTAPRALLQRTAVSSVFATLSYFALHAGAEWLTAGTLPPPPPPGPLEWVLLILAVFSFGLVAFAQATFPLWAYHPAAAGLRVHLSNGLYANAVFDRLISQKRVPPSAPAPVGRS